MKKTYLIPGFAALLALASCAEEEPVQSYKGEKIAFRSEMNTRASETTNANLSSIRVTSFLGDQTLFDAVDFNKGSDNFFTSQDEYYWPGDNSTLNFIAYAPAAPGGNVSITNDAKTLTDFSPATSFADQVDFITSKASGNKEANEASGVELVFDHRLSQIEVNAKADNNVYTFKISGVRIGQPVSKGSFDFDSNTWTLGTDKAIYTETYDTPITLTASPQNIMGESGNAMLIPKKLTGWNPTTDPSNSNNGAYISVKLQINSKAGAQVYPFPEDAECVWASIPISENWEAGKKYVYTLDLSHGGGYVDPKDPKPGVPVLGDPIKFTVDVVAWDSQSVDQSMKTN